LNKLKKINIKIHKSIAIILTVIFTFSICNTVAYGSVKEFRGIWVATVYAIDYPSSSYTSDDTILKSIAIELLDNVKDMGFNAVFLQVRPSADAFYKSEIFPWSKYLTGEQGKSPDNNFDPLEFFVEEAHKRGIELHAWINPYRVTASATENDLLDEKNPAVLNPEVTVLHTDGKIYFNPGEPEARQIVINGVKEIIENYDVDGIHLDDYFYPDNGFDDLGTYVKYGGGFSNIEDWRRNNNDLLIREIHDVIDSTHSDVSFGVSPKGIWANKSSNPLGSNTNGSQSYYTGYADTRKWVKEGYIDYILPQIYWNIGYSIADYEKLVNWWADTVNGTNVKLYIGQAAYKTGNIDISSPWYGVSEIERQVDLNRITSNVDGYSMYSFNSFINNEDLYQLIKQLQNTNNLTLGDVTQDGATDYKDALHLLQYTVELVDLDLQAQMAADCDGSGDINILDVKEILRIAIGN